MQTFDFPEDDAPVDEWKEYVAALNAITLTMDQIERGYDAYIASSLEEREGVLIRFAQDEGILPPHVAATAIIMRADLFVDALSNGFDIKAQDPERYARIATHPFVLYREYGDYQVRVGHWDLEPDETDIVAV